MVFVNLDQINFTASAFFSNHWENVSRKEEIITKLMRITEFLPFSVVVFSVRNCLAKLRSDHSQSRFVAWYIAMLTQDIRNSFGDVKIFNCRKTIEVDDSV